VNKINNKTYVGSTIDLTTRLYKYFSLAHLSKSKTPIHNALLKYGHENFKLEILEENVDKDLLLEREQLYLDLLKPEYNVLKTAGSPVGYVHSAETREKMANRVVSEETRNALSLAATGRVLTEEDKKKISMKNKGKKLSAELHASQEKVTTANRLRGTKVEVTNVCTNEKQEFDTLTDAAKELNVSRPTVANALKNQTLIQKKYMVTKIIR